MFARRRHGVALRPALDGPGYVSPTFGAVPFVDASAILDGPRLHAFLVNRRLDRGEVVHVGQADGDLMAVESGELLTGPHAEVVNTLDAPDAVSPRPFGDVRLAGGSDGGGREIVAAPR